MSLQIFTLAYKIPDCGLETSNIRQPLHCGKAVNPDTFVCKLCDNEGDNISEKNKWYCDLTGTYWVWKNTDYDIKGVEQYRRRFGVSENEIKQALQKCDVVAFKPRVFQSPITLRQHYDFSHNVADLDLVGEIVKELYPEMWDDFDKYINNGNVLFTNNSFIAKRETFDNICEILFSILFEYEKRMGYKTYDDWIAHGGKIDVNEETKKWIEYGHPDDTVAQYQSRVCGYLAERILTFIFLSKYNIAVTPMVQMEPGA